MLKITAIVTRLDFSRAHRRPPTEIYSLASFLDRGSALEGIHHGNFCFNPLFNPHEHDVLRRAAAYTDTPCTIIPELGHHHEQAS